MRGTITIDDINVGMAANAASPFVYKTVFREDFLRKCTEAAPDPDLYVKMGFVMAMQAEKGTQEVLKLKELDFINWLEQFTPMGPLLAAKDIADLFQKTRETTSVPKDEAGKQTGRTQ